MKVWIVNKKKIKKLVVKVAWFENGKEKTQTKESFNYNEKKKAEALKITLQNKDKIDAVDQKITFKDAFNSYIKTIEQGTLNIPEYIDTQVGYINNHIAPYIKRTLGKSKIDFLGSDPASFIFDKYRVLISYTYNYILKKMLKFIF